MSPQNSGDRARDRARDHHDGARGRAVQTATDVRRVIAEEIAHVTANADLDPVQRARVVAQLARVALRAIELGTLEARLEAVEATLKLRKATTPLTKEVRDE